MSRQQHKEREKKEDRLRRICDVARRAVATNVAARELNLSMTMSPVRGPNEPTIELLGMVAPMPSGVSSESMSVFDEIFAELERETKASLHEEVGRIRTKYIRLLVAVAVAAVTAVIGTAYGSIGK